MYMKRQSAPTSDLPLTIQVNVKQYLRRLGVPRFILAAVLLGFVGVYADPITAGIIIGSVVVILGISFFHISRLKVEVTTTHIRRFGGLAKSKTIQLTNLAPVLGFLQYVEPGFGVYPRIILRDTTTRTIISLQALYWGLEDIQRLAAVVEALGKEAQYYEGLATSAMIAKQFPDYLPLHERRPYALAFGIVGILMIAIAVVGVISYVLFADA